MAIARVTGEYEYAFVQLTRSSQPQKFGASSCGYGGHEAKSEKPFLITVWGLGMRASYGYPAGLGLRPLNDVRVGGPN